MPDISIIVPIYNAEKYIDTCLNSLLKQTKKELEILLINDGSTDKTEEVINKYSDNRIKYFKNKNQGIGKTRNFGIKKATGKYIMFIDSDDYISDDACEILYNKAQEDNLDVVICDYYKIENKIITEQKLMDFESTTLKDNPDLINSINLSPWNKLYKTSFLKSKNIQFAEDIKYEDAPFVLEVLDKARKIGKVNNFLNYYVVHENSETSVRDERVFDILKIIDMIRKYFRKKVYISESLDKLTVRIITNYTIQQRVQVDQKLGMRFIDEAFCYLKKEVPDYKKNKYYNNRGILRRTIEKNKIISKFYCRVYHFIKF